MVGSPAGSHRTALAPTHSTRRAPAAWAGLDTLLPPLVSLAAFYITAKLTAKGSEAEANTGVLAAEGAN